jgi:hypothetical protein
VAFAGRVPRRGGAVSLRCGALTATVLGLGATPGGVHRGARLRRGQRLGVAGPGGRIRLGARVSARRFGYRDPLALLGRDARRPERGPVGLPARRPRVAPPAPSGVRVVAPAGAPDPVAVPLLAWLGLGLLAVGVPTGARAGAGRRRRAGARRDTRPALGPG